MKGFRINIEKIAKDNTSFRKVLYTSKHIQLVLMSLQAMEEIGEEIHPGSDQFFRVESGQGKCTIDGNEYEITSGDAIVVPAGAKHNIINTQGNAPLSMYTIYSPAHHKDKLIRATKEEAELAGIEFDGVTTE